MVTQSKKHTPINFDPSNYEIVAWFDNQPEHLSPEVQFLVQTGILNRNDVREMMEAHQKRRKMLFPDGQDHHHCQHCGQAIRYVAVAEDKRDGKNVPFGEICADNRLSLPDRASFEREFIHTEANRLKKQYKKQAERARAKEKFCQEHPEFIEAYNKAKELNFNGFIGSIIEQFEANGKLSDKQVECFIPAVEKAMEKHQQRELQRQEDAKTSEWIGEVGDRLEITATVQKITHGEGYYGEWTLTILKDADGNVITYFNAITDKESGRSAEEGDTIKFKGTVKAHKEREGVKQTQIQRASKGIIINSGSEESEPEFDDNLNAQMFTDGRQLMIKHVQVVDSDNDLVDLFDNARNNSTQDGCYRVAKAIPADEIGKKWTEYVYRQSAENFLDKYAPLLTDDAKSFYPIAETYANNLNLDIELFVLTTNEIMSDWA